MYEEHIRAAARSMAENMQRSPVPMYGKGLRLPDKGAVIGLLKEIRRRPPRRRSCSPIRGCLPFSYTGWPMSCICARFP